MLLEKIIRQQQKLEALASCKVKYLYVGFPYTAEIYDELRGKGLSGMVQEINGMEVVPAESRCLRFGVEVEI